MTTPLISLQSPPVSWCGLVADLEFGGSGLAGEGAEMDSGELKAEV